MWAIWLPNVSWYKCFIVINLEAILEVHGKVNQAQALNMENGELLLWTFIVLQQVIRNQGEMALLHSRDGPMNLLYCQTRDKDLVLVAANNDTSLPFLNGVIDSGSEKEAAL